LPSQTTGTTGLAGRYATALFQLAEADASLDEVADDLNSLGNMIEDSDDLRRLIRSPALSRHAQGNAMAAVAERAGLCDLVRRFVGVLAHNRRLFAVPDTIAAYQALWAAHRGEETAEVISASQLSDKQMSALTESLKKAMGVDVAVNARVDPGLLGGLVVQVGSRMVDSSLATKLQSMRLAMKGTA
jgi:F-type H+-transporting ATPase subunit delta